MDNTLLGVVLGVSITGVFAIVSKRYMFSLERKKTSRQNKYLLLRKLYDLTLYFEGCVQESNKGSSPLNDNWPDIKKFQNICTNDIDSDLEMFLFHKNSKLYGHILEFREFFYKIKNNVSGFKEMNLPDHIAMYEDVHGDQFRKDLADELNEFIKESRKWALSEFKSYVS